MKVSVLVLTFNRFAALRECLTRIQANTVERDAEIIVIENGSDDGTAEWLDANADVGPLPLRVIHMPENIGVSARNEGFKIARGDYILQCDDDVLVHAGWDRVLVEPMERDPQIAAAGQEAMYQEQSWTRTPWSAGFIDDRRRPAIGQCADLLMGYCYGLKNLRKPDGSPMFLYNPDFRFWHEEGLLNIEMRAAGYRLMTVKPVAMHRSLPHIRSFAEDVEMAERNFQYIKALWQNDPRLTFEGPRVGLR